MNAPHRLFLAPFLAFASLASAQQVVFQATFDTPTVDGTTPAVPVNATGWAVHHGFLGRVVTDGPLNAITTQNLSTSLGDPNAGTPRGYLSIFINDTYNVTVDGVTSSVYGSTASSPGPHPTAGTTFNNRTLSVFAWTSASVSTTDRASLQSFSWFQGNRDALFHSFAPAVRIGDQWYTYTMTTDFLNSVVRERGAKENVFSGNEMIGANQYNAQRYTVPWSELGWSLLVFSGTATTDSPTGLSLGQPLAGALPAGEITGIGMFSNENITTPYTSNGLRLDSVTLTAIPEPSTLALLGLAGLALAWCRPGRRS